MMKESKLIEIIPHNYLHLENSINYGILINTHNAVKHLS